MADDLSINNTQNANVASVIAQYQAMLDQAAAGADPTKAATVVKEAAAILKSESVKVVAGGTPIAKESASGATPTGAPALDFPDDEIAKEANLEKLIAFLQMENDEKQSKLAQERIDNCKGQIDTRHANRMEKIKESIQKAKEAENANFFQKLIKWIGVALLGIAAVGVSILTGGAAVGLLVAFGLALATAIMDETGATEAIVKKLAEKIREGSDLSKAEAQAIAQAIVVGVMLIAQIAAGFAGGAGAIGGVAKALEISEKTVKTATMIAMSAMSTVQLTSSGYSTYTGYDAQEAGADTKETEKYLQAIQHVLDEEEELLQQLLDKLQNSVSTTMEIINSATDAEAAIAQQIGQMA